MIFQFFLDKFEKEDYKNAYIVLFIGKKGDGKRSAINAFFNIIKGINIENNYKYILIEEKEDQSSLGLHLYYLKDFNNKPIIIIDCNGYGDIKGKEYDEKITKAFSSIFGDLLSHINLVCYVVKESEEKLNILTQYILGWATSIFCKEIKEQFIFLITHADKNTIKSGPNFISSLTNDIYFEDIFNNDDKKWYYSIDSKSIFNNEIDEITKYSFDQLNELYKEKIQNSKKILIQKSKKLIDETIEIKSLIDNIISNFKNLKEDTNKIPNLDSNIKYYEKEISNKNSQISYKNQQLSQIYSYESSYYTELRNLEKEHNQKMNALDNEYETINYKDFEYTSNSEHTYCYECKRNCHHYCDCYGFLVDRCNIFGVFWDYCSVCNHSKSNHSFHSHYHYVDKSERRKIPNYDKKSAENDRYNRRKNDINSRLNNKRYEKENINRDLNKLNNEKNTLQNSKNYYVNEKDRINKNNKRLNNDISIMIEKLIDISKNIEDNALNKNQIELENEYIDFLVNEIKFIDNEKKEKLKKVKEYNRIYKELSNNYFYLLGFKLGTKY